MTGVSKFSKASIFSGLNNLEDISLTPRFGTICGYTQNDIETTFLPYLKGVDLEELKEWYNGYNFLNDRVYNPFDILLFIKNDFLFDNYEGFYASVVYAYFAGAGFDRVIAEDVTSDGRIDLSVFIDEKVYIFEFKVDDSSAL